ncbi:hypothetical protein ScPMuIL_001157 [Solemya velum]
MRDMAGLPILRWIWIFCHVFAEAGSIATPSPTSSLLRLHDMAYKSARPAYRSDNPGDGKHNTGNKPDKTSYGGDITTYRADPVRGRADKMAYTAGRTADHTDCCNNRGLCILGSFCHCLRDYYGRYCQYDRNLRDCGPVPHGAWVRSGCSVCRCYDGHMTCLAQIFPGCENDGLDTAVNPYNLGADAEVVPEEVPPEDYYAYDDSSSCSITVPTSLSVSLISLVYAGVPLDHVHAEQPFNRPTSVTCSCFIGSRPSFEVVSLAHVRDMQPFYWPTSVTCSCFIDPRPSLEAVSLAHVPDMQPFHWPTSMTGSRFIDPRP